MYLQKITQYRGILYQNITLSHIPVICVPADSPATPLYQTFCRTNKKIRWSLIVSSSFQAILADYRVHTTGTCIVVVEFCLALLSLNCCWGKYILKFICGSILKQIFNVFFYNKFVLSIWLQVQIWPTIISDTCTSLPLHVRSMTICLPNALTCR